MEIGDMGIPVEVAEFYRQIEAVRNEYQVMPDTEYSISWENTVQREQPLIAIQTPCFDNHQAFEIFNRLKTVLGKYKKDRVQGLRQISADELGLLLAEFIRGESVEIADQPEECLPALSFLIFETVKVFMHKISARVKTDFPQEKWLLPACPVCGQKADYAVIKEDGKRFLHCPMCGMEWLYKRLACPNCLNEDHRSLGYISVEGLPGYQISYCENCKSYLKTLDERLNPGLTGDSVAVRTIFLDLLARRKGLAGEVPVS